MDMRVVGVKTIKPVAIAILAVLALSSGAIPGLMNGSTVHAQVSPATLEFWSDQYGSNLRTPDGKLNITDLNLTIGQEFDVKVNVTGAGPINVFDLTISYDYYVLGTLAGVLDAVSVFLQGGLFDPDNPPPGCSITIPTQRVDVPPGFIKFTAGIVVTSPACAGTVDGTGTLLTIIFRVLKEGSTSIEIRETETTLVGVGTTGTFKVPFVSADAYFRNKPGVPPVADFSYEPTTPVVGDAVKFNATLSFDPDNSTQGQDKGIKRFAWSFGDGTFGTGSLLSHVFVSLPGNTPIPGNFSVTLVVWDFNNDLSASKKVTVNVQARPINNIALSISLTRSSLSVGDTLNVSVSVTNRGNRDLTMDLVIHYDFQGKTILSEESNTTLTVKKRTMSRNVPVPTGTLAPRTYTVTAEGTIVNATGTVPDDDPSDNTRTASFVILPPLQSSLLSVPVLIGIGAAFVAVVAALGYLLRRRKTDSS